VTDLLSALAASADYKVPTNDNFSYPELYGPITIDTETHDPYLTERGAGWAYDLFGAGAGKIVGISVHADNFHEYLPIGHTEANLDPKKVKGWLSGQLTKDDTQPKVFANSMYDWGWMEAEGIKMSGDVQDVMYQAPLIDENRMAYSLDRLGKDYLGFGKDEHLLLEAGKLLGIKNSKKDNVKKHMMRFHPNLVGLYANQDTAVTRGLWDYFNPVIEADDLSRVYQLELDLIPMHIKMRMRGVRVDVDEAELQQKILLEAEASARKFIKRETGILIGSWDNAAELATVFDKIGITYERTAKTQQPSITQDWLRSLKHPISDTILTGRKVSNNRATFIENAILNLQQRGRIFPNFNQLRKDSDDGAGGVIGKELKTTSKGAVSGRYSSSGPNFQQIPSPERDDPNADFQLGSLVRGLFLPEEGEEWHGLDYSSQEPRGIIHFAELTKCKGAHAMAEKFREDPNTDIHLQNAILLLKKKPDFAPNAKSARKPVKTIGLGIAYGMGGGKLCYQLGLPYTMSTWITGGKEIEIMKAGPEGVEIMNAFDESAPYIRQLAEICKNRVRSKGYIVTPMGRRFHFPKDEAGKYMYLNKALNRLIQGTSADMTKLAMRDLYRNGILPHGTVHDEIDISTSDPEVVKRAKYLMENSLKMTIPIVVDVGTGKNWGISSGKEGGRNYRRFIGEEA